MIISLTDDTLPEAGAIAQESGDAYMKYVKVFSKLRLTMNALHLMKSTDKENSETYETLQEKAVSILLDKNLRS